MNNKHVGSPPPACHRRPDLVRQREQRLAPATTKAADRLVDAEPDRVRVGSAAAQRDRNDKACAVREVAAPAGFKQAAAVPPVMCAFESSDARVSVTVGPGPASFEQLQLLEENVARSNGVTPPVLEQVPVDGWSFAAIWPELVGFNRMDRYLVDSAGNALACKVGVAGRQGRRDHPGGLL